MNRISAFVVCLGLLSIMSGQDKELQLASLEGAWEGTGGFLDVKLAEEIGVIPIKIIFNADGQVSGTIGNAILTETGIKPWNENGFEVRAIIAGSLKEELQYTKDHFVLFGVISEEEMDLNYHLKSNFFFDFSMNVCGVILKRVE